MARYAQNTTCGQTCPWGSGDADMPDAFTIAAMKAARRRESKETITSEAQDVGRSTEAGSLEQAQVPKLQEISPRPDALKSSRSTEALTTWRSAASRASRASRASTSKSGKGVEAKMMNLIQKCLDKKVLEIQEVKVQAPASEVSLSARSSETVLTQMTQPEAPSHVETDTSVKADPQPEAVTMAGKRAQAQKLSGAALGKFDDDQSRLAYLDMQKSAADARNKNRSSLCFGYEDVPQYPALLHKAEGPAEKKGQGTQATMAGKRAKAQKVSDATLGKFDADKSMDAYLDMQKSAEERDRP